MFGNHPEDLLLYQHTGAKHHILPMCCQPQKMVSWFMECSRTYSAGTKKEMVVTDSLKGIIKSRLCLFNMEPKMDFVPDEAGYIAQLYKTSARAGVFSTNGHSTNFVAFVHLPSKQPQDYWISKGATLLCQLSEETGG
nr:dynein heavy chain 6, axonemal-like isoform X2 [Crassostrea virginica]